jgi:hypothetical protein
MAARAPRDKDRPVRRAARGISRARRRWTYRQLLGDFQGVHPATAVGVQITQGSIGARKRA